jgi:hypothetical protein
MQLLCECSVFYLISTWMIGLIWVIQDWDEILAKNIWMYYFPRLAAVAVILHILISPYSVPEAIWESWHGRG